MPILRELEGLSTTVQEDLDDGFLSAGAGGVSDPDAQAFITAAAITDNTQKNAINNLVIAFKAASIWTKMHAIYPMVGGTAATHKFNLKDPRDLDAAFRLVFGGGWTHSANGALPNGLTGYADTRYVLATNGVNNDSHLSYYSRTNIQSNCDFASINGADFHQLLISYAGLAGNFACFTYTGANAVNVATGDSLGLFVDSRRAAADHETYKNGVTVGNEAAASAGFANITFPYYIGARNNVGTADEFSVHQCAFASIGLGLTDTDATNMYTAVQAFQTALARQV